MKAHLMFRDADFDMRSPIPANADALIQDLELETILRTMASGDAFLHDVARKALLSPLSDPNAIRYRHDLLRDALRNAAVVRELYAFTIEAIERKKKSYFGFFSRYPSSILGGTLDVMQIFVDILARVRRLADEKGACFSSEGFSTLFEMIRRELSDDYFNVIRTHLKNLRFDRGVLVSAALGKGNAGVGYVLRRPNDPPKGFIRRILEKRPAYSFRIPERDENGARALSELRDRGINDVANILSRSAEHILGFFLMLQTELAFYAACINLSERLAGLGTSVSFPVPEAVTGRSHCFSDLYDVSLSIRMNRKIVGNDMNGDGKNAVIIPGAHQGGKTTFLRSIGQAQLMMQCGMFVPAASFRANACRAVFTHSRREEDASMKSGKLDEELGRMSAIVDSLAPDAIVLFNESFAATNEREGSEIARQITTALLERRVKIFFVTHLYEFSHGLSDEKREDILFLRAERKTDGERTFRIVEGVPLRTSFGEDVFRIVFGPKRPEEREG